MERRGWLRTNTGLSRVGQRLRRAGTALREARRRRWSSDARLWVELRTTDVDEVAGIAKRVASHQGVVWARYNAAFERLVVQRVDDGPDDDALMAVVRDAEESAGVDRQPFSSSSPKHPGDRGSAVRSWIRAGASVASLGLGATLRVARGRTPALEMDLAALSQGLENLPQARKWLDQRLGGSLSDFTLGLSNTMSMGVAHGVTGQAVDLVYRAIRLRELEARQAVWERREAELGGNPAAHPDRVVEPGPREAPLPTGPIEAWSERAAAASLGGFGFAVAASGRAETAAASIFGVVPKPARVGREAFAAVLGRRLAQRGMVILEDRALRRLDRIDCVLFPAALLRPSAGELRGFLVLGRTRYETLRRVSHQLFHPEDPRVSRQDGEWSWSLRDQPLERLPAQGVEWAVAQRELGWWVFEVRQRDRLVGLAAVRPLVDQRVRAMVATAQACELKVVVSTSDPSAVAWCAPDELLAPGPAVIAEIRALQRHGHGVLVVASGPDPALAAADIGLALQVTGTPTAWQAHLIGADGVEDVLLLLQAMRAARRASTQSAYLAMIEALSALTLSLDGQKRSAVERILAVSGVLSFAAVANGARVARGVRPPRTDGPDDRTPWHALEPAEVLQRLGTPSQGLVEGVARARIPPPEVERTTGREFAAAVWTELATPFAPILATGAGLSAMVGSPVDAALIAATVLASGLVGGVQRVQAEGATRALAQRRQVTVRVRREGSEREVPAEQLVRGDILLLEAGDRVPADCRILQSEALEVDESSLTGESLPVVKGPEPSYAGAVADRTSMLFADTTVAAGRVTAVVVATGRHTEARRAGLERPGRTPVTGVEARLESLTQLVTPVGGLAGLAVVASGLVRHRPARELVDTAVSLAVAAVPETLPLLATAAQLASARRLSERGALVRNPRAVEALGRVDVLCADKTGTLTEGTIVLQAISDAATEAELGHLSEVHREVLAIALGASPPPAATEAAHPTDRAVHRGAAQVDVAALPGVRTVELPFEPRRGFHATLLEVGRKRRIVVKGAPEVVLRRCDRVWDDGTWRKLDREHREALVGRSAELAARGYRVLAVAERPARSGSLDDEHVQRLIFRGFLALADPVRTSALAAIRSLRAAGVEVMMITGDHPSTASAIAAALELADGRTVTGAELELLDDAAFDAVLPEISVVARATPAIKVRIVEALQRSGRVVAMTGDGANDAPAIRLADVGIALGDGATPAARGAADLLVTDGRIETIVEAVLEGRAMWASVREAVALLVGGNLGEIAFTVLGGVIEGTAPLNARQLMLVNLVTDALPALAIAVRPPDPDTSGTLLSEGPEASLGDRLDHEIAWRAAVTAASAWGAWLAARPLGGRERASTVALLALVGAQLGQTVAIGHRSRPVVVSSVLSWLALVGIVETPGLSGFAGSRVLGPVGLGQAAVATVAGTTVGVVVPPLARRLDRRFQLVERWKQLKDEEIVRALSESRLLQRLRNGEEE